MAVDDVDGSSADEEEELAQLPRCRWSMRPRCSGREGAASLAEAACNRKDEREQGRKAPSRLSFYLQWSRRWLKKK